MKSNINALLLLLCIKTACTAGDQTSTRTNDPHGVIIADSKGIHISYHSFSPDQLYPKKKWQGDWIGLNKDQYAQYQETHTAWINNHKSDKSYRALFRKTFDVKELPPWAILCITADVSFRAYVNGHFVCQGPANIGSDYDDHKPPEHWFFSTHDVKKYLQIGRNIIAVEVYSFDLALAETTSGKAKLICDLDVDLNRPLLYTDTSWKCHLDTCLTRVDEGLIYNAMVEIPDWESNHFNDDHWPHASLQDADKDGFLIQSQIPTTIRHPVKAIETWQNTHQKDENRHECSLFGRVLYDESCTWDFGRNMSAYYTISLMAGQGDTVKIVPREKSAVNRALVYICRKGKNNFTTPQLNVFRYLTVQVASREGLKIDSFYALYSSYPTRYAGSFACSDSFYTQLWDIIRWTTQMCMNSLYLDSPRHQEPIACTGDYLIESLSNYYAFGDPWLARQDLIKTARMLKKNSYDMFHTSYSLLWVQMLYNYYHYTGDKALIKELLPHVNKLNDLFATYLDENYILSQAPDYMFMDWIKIDKFNAHHPPAVIGMGYLTAFYYQSLILASNFNQMNGDVDKSKEVVHLAEKIKQGINRWLWDENKGIYKDGIFGKSRIKSHRWLPEDEDIVTYSPHVNTLAVLYDIAPQDQQAFIMDYVLQQKEIDLQPYFMYFVLSALVHIEKFDQDGLTLINKWKNGLDMETYTLKENWQDQTEFGYSGDFSHAWGGSPLYFMSAEILGISLGKPGYQEIKFVPYISDRLIWAKGTVPLNDGDIVSIYWERSGESKYSYHIEIPQGHKAVLYYPDTFKSYHLSINHQTCANVEKQMTCAQGKYIIEYTKKN